MLVITKTSKQPKVWAVKIAVALRSRPILDMQLHLLPTSDHVADFPFSELAG